MSDSTLMDLRLADVEAFLAVCRAKSVSNVARQFGVTPSQVSKAIARLERHLQVELLDRNGGKVAPSAEGARLIASFDEVVKILRAIRASESAREHLLTFASPSYLQGHCLAAIAEAVSDVRLRGVELGPSQIRGFAPDGLFDVAVTTSDEGFGESWHVERLGNVRSALLGMPSLVDGLGPPPVAAERLVGVPFISPKAQGSAVLSDDGCPLGIGERLLGHEVQTFGAGLELATRCAQVVFGPVLAARSHLERGVLKAIDVDGWDVRVPLFLVSNVDRVRDSVRRAAAKNLTVWLEREG